MIAVSPILYYERNSDFCKRPDPKKSIGRIHLLAFWWCDSKLDKHWQVRDQAGAQERAVISFCEVF